jgi:hypothetical protein
VRNVEAGEGGPMSSGPCEEVRAWNTSAARGERRHTRDLASDPGYCRPQGPFTTRSGNTLTAANQRPFKVLKKALCANWAQPTGSLSGLLGQLARYEGYSIMAYCSTQQ